jgi:hypothetical protein
MSRLACLDWLGQKCRPHYGQLTLYSLLVCASALCAYFQLRLPAPPTALLRTGPASVLSFLPDAVLLHDGLFRLGGLLFFLGAVLWAVGVGVPWSGWLASLGFTAVVALYLERSTQATHVAHLTDLLLLLYALWYHLYACEIRQARARGCFWTEPLYPRWVHAASVFVVGTFYGFSGLNKWLKSGLAWPNGLSLQLWVRLWGDPDSVWVRLLLSDRRPAAALQWATLLAETGGFVAILSRRLRPLIGLALIGFHVGAICVFGWGFHANLLLIALVFLPFDRWVPRWVAGLERRTGPAADRARAEMARARSVSEERPR